jgi:hypothetical protein
VSPVSQQFTIGLDDLAAVLEPIEDEFPALKPDRFFVLWFVRAFGSGDMAQAAEALPGPNREKGLDAVFIDHSYRRIVLVQGKYRTALSPASENWSDIIELIDAAACLAGEKQKFDDFCHGIDERVKALLKQARSRLLGKEDWDLDVCYATSGFISSNHRSRALRRAERIELGPDKNARFVPYTRSEVLGLVEREMDGPTPPVPPIVLPMTSRSNMEHVERVGNRASKLTMWVFSVNGRDFAKRVKPYRMRIFNANVRGFLGIGEEGINREILTTIEKSPHHFALVNNGVTMLASEAKPDRRGGIDVMVVHEPQIVNGQQTTRVLEAANDHARRVSVLVRVIEVPPTMLDEMSGDESLTNRIVKATNRQNRITAADLKSNHRTQVWLEKELEQLGYRYVRKRESRQETSAGPRARKQLKKEALARAVASCENDTWGLRGQEPLFDEHYDTVFASKDPWLYALRFVLFDHVSTTAKSSAEKTWARFAVVRFIWKRLGKDLKRHRKVLVPALQRPGRSPAIQSPLDKLVNSVSSEAVAYFRAKGRNEAGERVDVQKFFKRAGAYEGFETWWRSQRNKHRTQFNQAANELRGALAKDGA